MEILEKEKEDFQNSVPRWMRRRNVSKRYRIKQMQRMARKGNRDLGIWNSKNREGRVGLNALKV